MPYGIRVWEVNAGGTFYVEGIRGHFRSYETACDAARSLAGLESRKSP